MKLNLHVAHVAAPPFRLDVASGLLARLAAREGPDRTVLAR